MMHKSLNHFHAFLGETVGESLSCLTVEVETLQITLNLVELKINGTTWDKNKHELQE